MKMARLWAISNGTMTVVGCLATLVSAYYTAGTYYGWDKEIPIVGGGAGAAPPPQASGAGHVSIAPDHFPAWLLTATFATSVALLGMSVAMMVYRRSFLRVSKPPLTPGQLYVGQMVIGIAALKSDYVVEITARAYNGTSSFVKIQKVSGSITCIAGVNQGSEPLGSLPTPTLRDVFATTVPGHTELMVALEQRVPGNVAAAMLQRLESGDVVQLMLKDLEILVANDDGQTARLPVWGGMMCRKVGELGFASQIITAEVNVSLHSRATTNPVRLS